MIARSLQEEVTSRADHRCEYCKMHQSLRGGTFHVEHIVPLAKGGATITDNLALACPGCNLHKSDRVEIVDPQTGQTVRPFSPAERRLERPLLWG